MSSVAVIGDALLDVHVTAASPLRRGADIPAAIRLEAGGQGANLAVRLARRGITVRLSCALADDPAGAMLRAALAADGVELLPIDVAATGSVVVLVAADGERTMLSQRVPLLSSLDLDDAAGAASWLVLSGYPLLEGDADRVGANLVLPVRRAVVGCAMEPPQADGWLGAVRALRPRLLVLNREEASLLVRRDDGVPALARRLARTLDTVAVVTEASGAAAAVGRRLTRVSVPTRRAADTTGAGDAFAAALVTEVLDEPWPPGDDALDRALRAACRAGAAVAGAVGAQVRVAGEGRGRLAR